MDTPHTTGVSAHFAVPFLPDSECPETVPQYPTALVAGGDEGLGWRLLLDAMAEQEAPCAPIPSGITLPNGRTP